MRLEDSRASPNFLSQALRVDDLTVYGDGNQTRSFCYIDDLIEGIRQVGDAAPRTVKNEVFNLGGPHEISINTLAETVLELVDTSSEIVYLERPTDDPDLRRPDIKRIRSVLGWEPTVGLQDGLERTIDSFRRELVEDVATTDHD